MSENVECPICGGEFRAKPLKVWKFRFYKVNRFECEQCKAKFNVYVGPKSKFTIPKAKR